MAVRWGVLGCGGIADRRTIPEGIIPAPSAELVAVQDIADTLGIGVSAVKMRLSRGREQMLRLMQTTGEMGDRYE